MVYEGVRDVRRSVLLMKDPDDGDTDSDVASNSHVSAKTTDTLGHNPSERTQFR